MIVLAFQMVNPVAIILTLKKPLIKLFIFAVCILLMPEAFPFEAINEM